MTILPPEQNAAFLLFIFFSPVLVALVKQSGFTRQANALIALGVYTAVGVGGAVWSGIPVTPENAIPLILTATVVGRAAYSLFWNQLGSDEWGFGSLDERITEATSVVPLLVEEDG
jgi:hypothetical protein